MSGPVAAPTTEPASRPDVDVVVPVYNERGSLDQLYERCARLGLATALVFVDNGSTDGSVERIRQLPGVRLIRHDRNLGYGASIRDGFQASRAAKVVVLDADLEYPPEAIPEMLRALDSHAVVYASRFLGHEPPRMAVMRRAGNKVISGAFNLLFGQKTTDFYTGMKAVRRDALDALRLTQDGFEHVVELGAQLVRQGHAIHEVPVVYTPRAVDRSKMRHLPEVLKYVAFVTRYWLRYVVRGLPVGAPGA